MMTWPGWSICSSKTNQHTMTLPLVDAKAIH
jgi:hypothetical protein